MDLVLAHRNMDFDSVAAQLAVTKLYPGTAMVPAHPLGDPIRNFFALYRDILPVVDLHYVDHTRVKRVFLVDCQKIERLDDRGKRLLQERLGDLKITIFDHHSVDETGLISCAQPDSIFKNTGSVTAILVNLIEEKEIAITPFEATVLAAGIYEDTGCLTHRGTTASDARAIAFLLDRGADLAHVIQMIRPRLTQEQLGLYEELASVAKTRTLAGVKVTVTSTSLSYFVDGLAEITSRLLGSTSSDVVVSVVAMKDRIYMVGRSETNHVDVGELARRWGGAGHAGAASASIRNQPIEKIVEEVETYLESNSQPEPTAAQIMITPVRTIRPDLDMDEANGLMLRHGLDGIVVMENDALVGIISKRDVDKARHHKLSHAPVRGFMSNPVITVEPGTPLSQLQKTMVREDIGRLPVVENGKLLGLVGRREILHALYGSSSYGRQEEGIIIAHKHTEDIHEKLERAHKDTSRFLAELGRFGAELGCTVYLVGGCVRDLLLDRPNTDLDFVVEGSAIELACNLAASHPDRFRLLAKHERFGTACIAFTEGNREHTVDLATARTEYYEFPASLPTVEPSSLEQDLFRRDFTINALAINLHPDTYGQVEDYYDGINDLKGKTIRILHPFSFIEDPTRIVRAVKFAARLDFTIEDRTMRQAQRAIELGIFDNLGGVRLKEEIRSVLEAETRLIALELLAEAGGGLRFLDDTITYDRQMRLFVRRAERLLKRYPMERQWIVYLGVLLSAIEPGKLADTLVRLQLSEDEKRWIHDSHLAFAASDSLDAASSRSSIYRTLTGYAEQSLAIAASLAPTGSDARRLFKLYFDNLKAIQPTLKGSDLLKMGVPQGPRVGKILKDLHDRILDGEVSSLEDEKQFVLQSVQAKE